MRLPFPRSAQRGQASYPRIPKLFYFGLTACDQHHKPPIIRFPIENGNFLKFCHKKLNFALCQKVLAPLKDIAV